MNAELFHRCRHLRVEFTAMAMAALALAPLAGATEQLTNRSFDTPGGAGWSVEPSGVWAPFATVGEVDLHRSYTSPPVKMLWQDLDISNVGGVSGTASMQLKWNGSPPPSGISTTVYLDYIDESSNPQQILLLNPNNSDVGAAPDGSLFSKDFTLPSGAQKVTGFSVYRTYGGFIYAMGFSLDLQMSPPPSLPVIVVGQPERMPGTHLTSGGIIGFGQSEVGIPEPSPLTFTVDNTGTGPLELAVTVEGDNHDDYVVTPPLVNPVLAGNSTTFTVAFTPSAIGTRTTTLKIASNDLTNTPFLVNLTGYGLETPMVAINSPTEGALFSSSVSIPLVATVNTSWANITKVDFYDDTNTLISTGQPSLEGAWLFPDGENFQLLTVTSGQGMMDYYDNLHQHMYNFVGSLESPLSLFGTLTDTWSEMTAPGGMTFSVGPNNTLDAQLYGMVLYGQSVTLTGGTNFAASQQFTFSWAHAGSGPHVLTARAHYGTGRIVTSAPLNITVEAAPEIVINGGFETGALAPWPNSGLVPPVITAAAAHSGQYGLELTSTFPPAFALQDIQTRLTADTLYSFTAWINIMQVVDVGQMAYYVPHLHINAGPSSVVAYATNALGLGWQKLEVSRSFTAAELQDTVTLGVGGCGQLRIDDISAAAAAATGYAAWALANFSQPEQAQGLADPAADPDGRGVPNLLRYGLGLMPRTPQLAMLPRLVQSSGTPGELAFEFDIPAPPPADVAYFLGVSSDLQRWDETALAGLTPEFDQTTGGRRLIRVVAPDPAPGQSRVFMTLIVR